MDMQKILEQLLSSGKQVAEKSKELALQGVDFAADKIGIPEEKGEARDQAMGNLGKGAAVGGIIALLLGTKTGRRIAGPALKIGTLAALGGLGYKLYSDWQKSKGEEANDIPVHDLTGNDAINRNMSIVTAMIAAAKADGHVDSAEMERIESQIEALGMEKGVSSYLLSELSKPMDIAAVAEGATNPAAAVEIYLASLMFIDPTNEPERNYLDQLASKMNLSNELVQKLESEAFETA